MSDCIFCNIVQGKIPSFTVYSDDQFTAFLDINPANPGHVVLLPKAHFKSIMEMDDSTYARFFIISRALSLALLEYGAQGVNFLHSMGEAAGQRIPHVMLHMIPRYQNDNVHLVWDPQKIEQSKFEEIKQKIASLINIPQGQAPPQPVQQPQQTQPVQPQVQQPPQPKEEIIKLPPRTGSYW